MNKFAKHGQKYILKDGTIAPSVTTYINELGWNKQTLINWAKRLTFGGLDADKVLQDLAETGTLLHLMIEGSIKGFDVDTKEKPIVYRSGLFAKDLEQTRSLLKKINS